MTTVCVVSAIVLSGHQALAATPLTVNLGSASGFAVLAGSAITIAGPANSTTITGDIGSHPTVAITGLENLILNGTNHAGSIITQNAKTDLASAIVDASGRSADSTWGSGYDLTSTLFAGVYKSTGSFSLNGVLELDAQNNPDSVWIFQMESTLDVASAGQVILTNGALASNVFWQVGSSATLATGARVSGSILATASIDLLAGSVLDGRALANAAVTLGSTTIAIPEPSSSLLALIGGCALLGLKRRR